MDILACILVGGWTFLSFSEQMFNLSELLVTGSCKLFFYVKVKGRQKSKIIK